MYCLPNNPVELGSRQLFLGYREILKKVYLIFQKSKDQDNGITFICICFYVSI